MVRNGRVQFRVEWPDSKNNIGRRLTITHFIFVSERGFSYTLASNSSASKSRPWWFLKATALPSM